MIIEFETAKLSKEVGFIGIKPTGNVFRLDKSYAEGIDKRHWNKVKDVGGIPVNYYEACTQAELQTWLRDTKKLFLKIDIFTDDNCEVFYDYAITDLNNPFNNMDEEIFVVDFFSKDDEHKTYEKALEAGLVAGLKLINYENLGLN